MARTKVVGIRLTEKLHNELMKKHKSVSSYIRALIKKDNK